MYVKSHLTFEIRCKLAEVSLAGHKADIAKLQEENLHKLEEFKTNHKFVWDPEMDAGTDPKVVEKYWNRDVAVSQKILIDSFDVAVALQWDAAVRATRAIFGDDATDFALKTIERKSKPN